MSSARESIFEQEKQLNLLEIALCEHQCAKLGVDVFARPTNQPTAAQVPMDCELVVRVQAAKK